MPYGVWLAPPWRGYGASAPWQLRAVSVAGEPLEMVLSVFP